MVPLIYAICILSAAVALICGIGFWVRCLEVEQSWATPIPPKGEAHDRAISSAISRERQRKRIAIPVLVGFILTACLNALLQHVYDIQIGWTWPMMAAAATGLLIVTLRAMVHNDRCFEQRMKNRYGTH